MRLIAKRRYAEEKNWHRVGLSLAGYKEMEQ
jgi:hypothetical protein